MFFTKLQNLSKTQLGYLLGFLAESSFFRKNKNSGSVDLTASRDVEHRRFELLTPTLPVLCATNCANAPNSGYLIITIRLCKDFFSHVMSERQNHSQSFSAEIKCLRGV